MLVGPALLEIARVRIRNAPKDGGKKVVSRNAQPLENTQNGEIRHFSERREINDLGNHAISLAKRIRFVLASFSFRAKFQFRWEDAGEARKKFGGGP